MKHSLIFTALLCSLVSLMAVGDDLTPGSPEERAVLSQLAQEKCPLPNQKNEVEDCYDMLGGLIQRKFFDPAKQKEVSLTATGDFFPDRHERAQVIKKYRGCFRCLEASLLYCGVVLPLAWFLVQAKMLIVGKF